MKHKMIGCSEECLKFAWVVVLILIVLEVMKIIWL